MEDAGRNDPNGYEDDEKPQRYRIRLVLSPQPPPSAYELRGSADPDYELGEVVTRQTIVSKDPVTHRSHHSVHPDDQLYANLCTRLVQRACEYFYEPVWVPMLGAPDIRLTDDEVRESIHRLNLGENKREGVRTGKPWYDLERLPWRQQRALIEQLYAVRAKFAFEKFGPAE